MIGVKKTSSPSRKIIINNSHRFSQGNNGFQISPRMQELMVYARASDCYERCNEVIAKFLSITISPAQVYRVADTYGEQLGKPKDLHERTLTPPKQSETLYVEADGSMVLTREEGWKEVKVGRIFKSGDCLHPDGKVGSISHSQYIALLEDSRVFSTEFEQLIASFGSLRSRLVFISDGAPWIRNWITDAFGEAISILDYYHV